MAENSNDAITAKLRQAVERGARAADAARRAVLIREGVEQTTAAPLAPITPTTLKGPER